MKFENVFFFTTATDKYLKRDCLLVVRSWYQNSCEPNIKYNVMRITGRNQQTRYRINYQYYAVRDTRFV